MGSTARWAILALLVTLSLNSPAEGNPADTSSLFSQESLDYFETKVRPVLVERCYTCHGAEKQKNSLRLDSRSFILEGGESGPAAVPEATDQSKLIQAIRYDGDPKMPPKEKLPDEEIAALEHWVALGLPWPEGDSVADSNSMETRIEEAKKNHWAFQPVAKPEAPTIEDAGEDVSPVDRFVLANHKEAGLSLSPPADRRTLIRRVYYDVIGLPPSFEEVQQFVADDSPDAYEKVVDKLLASPRYGEKWARHWLDVARYADTKGYVFDRERSFGFSHTYRDYVIRSFNEDLPYNQFILEQIAADRLEPVEDKRTLAALGFLTVGRQFNTDIHAILDDRIDVVMRGLQGLTVSCARCHDHKFDPIPTEDYYSLYGILRSCHEPDELPKISERDPEDPQFQEFLKTVDEKEREVERFLDEEHVELLAQCREKVGLYLLAAHNIWDVTDNNEILRIAGDGKLHKLVVERWRDFLKGRVEGHDPVYTPFFAFREISKNFDREKASNLAQRYSKNEVEAERINPLLAKAFERDATFTMEDVCGIYGEVLRQADREWSRLLAARAQMAEKVGAASIELPQNLSDANAEVLRQVLYASESPANVPRGDIEQTIDGGTRNRLAGLRREVANVRMTHPGRPDRALVLYDDDTPFAPYVFKRGKPGNRGKEVPRAFLTVLAGEERKPFQNGSGRLELAQAIASPTNPLTARVLVNRIWMWHFGTPLVDTPSDFGLRTERPLQAELLDYLSGRFVEEGWSIKNLHRWILLSDVYRQSSAIRQECAQKDPDNRYYWRQNRRRLDFEPLRDSLLLASGKLDLATGGPSVEIAETQYQPRRTVYALIERQNLPAVFRTFDFASPDGHVPARYKTTVPQQALYLMNSPFLADQAQALAAWMREASSTDEGRIACAYQRLFQRDPQAPELEMGLNFLGNAEGAPTPVYHTPWRYGFGRVNEIEGAVIEFAELPHFSENQWKGGPDLPDATLGWVSHRAGGGHPGEGRARMSVLRWIAPHELVVSVTGELRHGQDQGNGVAGYIVSSREGVLWSDAVHNGGKPAGAEKVEVLAGDTLDFVVDSRDNTGFDSFSWSPRVLVIEAKQDAATRREWSVAQEFSGPPPAPLSVWERYAQALLMTNEFLFVD